MTSLVRLKIRGKEGTTLPNSCWTPFASVSQRQSWAIEQGTMPLDSVSLAGPAVGNLKYLWHRDLHARRVAAGCESPT